MNKRDIIEAGFDPFITINTQGKITDMNDALANITGKTRKHLTGSNFSEYFSDPQKAAAVYNEVFTKGYVANFPLTFHHQNGKLTDVLFNGSVYKDNRGNVLGAVVVASNMTEKKRDRELHISNEELARQNEVLEKMIKELITANKKMVRQNEANEKRVKEYIQNDHEFINRIKEKEKWEIANLELEAISSSLKIASQYSLSLIEASHDPLLTISPEGKITDMNGATSIITGISREKLKGTNFFNYFTNPQKARKVYNEIFDKGSIIDSLLTIRHIDGKLTDLLFNGSVYKNENGNVQGVVVVGRDVTDKTRTDKELTDAKVAAELSAEIAEIAKRKAESISQIAEEAVKAKQQFLSNMSHEIRTPMNVIIGFTKVLLKTELTEKQKEYLAAIKMSGDSLIVLINDILDLAKVDSGKMVFEKIPFKLAMSVSSMIHLFEPKINEKNLQLIKEYDTRIPEVILGDPVRLHQIILNLISNAVKFTHDGNVTLSVKLASEDEENVTIDFAVSDTGIGIAADKIDAIFENFQQAYSGTSRLYGGTGLGLSIVKQLVESQGGAIKVTSTINKGSTFSFNLTFKKTNENAEYEADNFELDVDAADIKILLVEDIVLNQLLMKTIIEDFGFECDIAANGKIAMEKLQMNAYDAVLMDLQMPVMSGFEATKHIRESMKSDIPIIALTADVTTVDLSKCKTAGMNDYIAKPVNEKILYNKIVGLVKKSKQANEDQDKAIAETQKTKCIDLDYLLHRTKKDPKLMIQMISLYLEQTPPLIIAMKKGFQNEEWGLLYSAIHKMIPSFSMMGIGTNFENMAKHVQEFASNQLEADGIPEMMIQIETVCKQACEELKEELIKLKQTLHE
ncbi:MAG: PAS domain S-box protein [Prolixibacteraceae bacterium]|nr:PAS domain S-box protein [Prolixibacteraceae bacterium]